MNTPKENKMTFDEWFFTQLDEADSDKAVELHRVYFALRCGWTACEKINFKEVEQDA